MSLKAEASPEDGVAGRRSAARGPGLSGVALAGLTAAVSGVSVFLNSYGVHAIASPALYTTAKNLVATLVLFVLVGAARQRRVCRLTAALERLGAPPRARLRRAPGYGARMLRLAALGYVGVIGGGLAFVLFFDGLAHSAAAPAAFLHDTLVIFVALFGLFVLRERLRWWNLAAIGLLVGGEVWMAGGVGDLVAQRGDLLVFSATLLWAVEVVVARVLLREMSPGALALVRMGVGSLALLAYLGFSGVLSEIVALDASQIGWALLTGGLLAAYVGTWMTALESTRALDVTSILVGSTLVTWLLELAAGSASAASTASGVILIAVGTGLVAWMAWPRPERASARVEVAGR